MFLSIRAFWVLIFLLSLPLPAPAKAVPGAYTGWAVVSREDDGDGFFVNIKGAKGEFPVRMLGIDAPELDQPHGDVAAKFLAWAVLGRRVYLKCVGRDKYGRLLCRVRHRGRDLAALFVAAGMAWAGDKKLKGLQLAARAARLGLWAGASPIHPGRWRDMQNQKMHGNR